MELFGYKEDVKEFFNEGDLNFKCTLNVQIILILNTFKFYKSTKPRLHANALKRFILDPRLL